ncbi:MAG: trypsin-like serine protease [Proteobacteria bacterium]|nr:MAG: trypsin-like serine protease [Pseudomonadota bacterium]
MKKLPVLFVCLGLMSACGGSPQNSSSKITNGVLIEETEYPAVVNLLRRILDKNGKFMGAATCTASWIDDVTLITAAHCLGDEDSDSTGKMNNPNLVVFEITDHTTDPKLTRSVTEAVEAYRNKAWENKKGFNKFDLAIVRFPPARAGERPRGRLKINHFGASVGDAVQIMGYGYNNMALFGKGGDDKKRIGNNQIDSVKDGYLNISGVSKDNSGGATGEDSSAGNGDSGGPMLQNGELIGIASGGGTGGIFARGESSYVDLSSAESKEFLSRFGY